MPRETVGKVFIEACRDFPEGFPASLRLVGSVAYRLDVAGLIASLPADVVGAFTRPESAVRPPVVFDDAGPTLGGRVIDLLEEIGDLDALSTLPIAGSDLPFTK